MTKLQVYEPFVALRMFKEQSFQLILRIRKSFIACAYFLAIDELFMIGGHVVVISNIDNAMYCLSKHVYSSISLK